MERGVTLTQILFQIGVFLSCLSVFAADEKECFNAGQMILLNSSEMWVDSNQLNKNKNLFTIYSYNQDFFKIFDAETNEIKEFPKSVESIVSELSNGELAYSILDKRVDLTSTKSTFDFFKKAKTVLINPKTGQSREIIGKYLIGKSLYSPVSYNEERLIVKSESGRMRGIYLNNKDRINFWTKDESDPEVTYNKKESKIYIHQNDRVLFNEKLKINTESLSGEFAPNKKLFLINISEEVGINIGEALENNRKSNDKLVVIDLAKKALRKYQLPKNYSYRESFNNHSMFSKDSRKLLLTSYLTPNDGVKTIDLETGTVSTVSKLSIRNPMFNGSGNICGDEYMENNKQYVVCLNSATGEVLSKTEIPLGLNVDTFISSTQAMATSWWGGRGNEHLKYYISENKICPKQIELVRCNSFTIQGQSFKSHMGIVNEIALNIACSKKFNEKGWKNLHPINLNSSFDEKASVVMLKRFSKPGGFNATDEHVGLMISMIKAGIHQKFPAEFKAALGGIIYSSDQFYDSLLQKYPEIAELPGKPDLSCQIDSEKKYIESAIKNYTKARILLLRRPKFSDFKGIISLAKSSLPIDQRESLATLAAEKLKDSSGDSAELHQIFASKVYTFAKNKMEAALELKYKDLTDVTVIRNKGNLVLYQLGISPFEGSKETVAGFHIKEVKKISVTNLPFSHSKERFNWKYGGNEYFAEIEIDKKKKERSIVDSEKSPKYSEMFKKTFRGVVVAGSNLKPWVADSIIKEYIEYYTQEGFSSWKTYLNEDIPKYLEGKVSGSEEMHYFVKEAHSDGDEKNLFRVHVKGKIIHGERKDGDIKEVVDLICPTIDPKTVLLSNQDFGRWTQEREKSKKPQLIYINSSCWSKDKAIFELSAADTPLLINIPTVTTAKYFYNDEVSVMRSIIDGLRKRKTYEAIRENMKKDPDYVSGKDNVFIFPDEEVYKTEITDLLEIPVNVDPKIFVKKNGNLVPYSIEEDQ